MGNKKTTDDLLDDIEEKIGKGFDNVMNFTDKAVTDDKYPAQDLVKDGVTLMFKNSALLVDFYRSSYNLLFRRKAK